jgi:hypothetical protein
VRRSTFKQSGGFDDSLTTFEDFQLSQRLVKYGKVKYSKDALVATSIRRIVKWGLFKFVFFHVQNYLTYNLFHSSSKNYEYVR